MSLKLTLKIIDLLAKFTAKQIDFLQSKKQNYV